MNRTRTYIIAISALMVALSFVIPAFMPIKLVVPGYFSATLFSHLPIMFSMFISPYVAFLSCLGTAGAFWMLFPGDLHVALRALSHILYAIPGSILISKGIGVKRWSIFILAFAVNIVHGIAEVVVVVIYWAVVDPAFLDLGFLILTAGLVTLIHGLIDYFSAIAVYEAGVRAKLLKPRFIWLKKSIKTT